MSQPDKSADKTVSEKLVDSVLLKAWSRASMIVATTILLPIGFSIGGRMISSMDQVADKIDQMRIVQIEQSGRIEALRQQLMVQQQSLADHEARVRSLERGPVLRQ
ncbi:hypothetical protein BRADO3654 [Bradyrhizobium sp. ORS 278]|uniref:hypothetical protein n=1 Tax=Bradyrhizobium sp. (strain ORS 278) TaxID=114615 RepID=UPI0001508F5A|nr:hypothetical protein [Bradyrhizobium sp. ORS 278]CAL77431.1 hypothetical protein BRADO3654 [Bradyrhizobium sp. ORS 278]